MAAECYSLVNGCAARVTLVDDCGRPVEGDCSTVVTDGFVTVDVSNEIDDGQEILLKNACGKNCVNVPPCAELKYVTLETEFCSVDPELLNILTGQRVIRDYKGDAVGFGVGSKIQCRSGFAMEIWSEVPQVECLPGQPGATYGYTVLPWQTNGIISGITIENDAITFTVTSKSLTSSQWGKGPYNVVEQDAAFTPGRLLEAVPSDEHWFQQLVRIAPPEPSCGCQELEICDEPGVLVEVAFDTDGDASFSNAETATDPDDDIVVRITVTNTDDNVSAEFASLALSASDGNGYDLLAGSGNLDISGACPPPAVLAPGQVYTCTVTINEGAPEDGEILEITAAAVVVNTDAPTVCSNRGAATGTVETDAALALDDPLEGGALALTVALESGAMFTADLDTPAINVPVDATGGDGVDVLAELLRNVTPNDTVTVNAFTLADSLGNTWDILAAGAQTAGTVGDLVGVGCASDAALGAGATCSDPFSFPTDWEVAANAALAGPGNVVLTLTFDATTAGGANQNEALTITLVGS